MVPAGSDRFRVGSGYIHPQLSANFSLFAHCCIFIFGSLLSFLRTGPRTFPGCSFIQN